MVSLNSSAIISADYDPESQELYVTFASGTTYTYFSVPAWKFDELIAAPSAGSYFNDQIRDRHASSR